MTDAHPLLEVSPYESDGGNLIGRDPRKVTKADFDGAGIELRRMNKAIRAKCLDCVGNSESEVRKCVSVKCPLWPMRMGRLPAHLKPQSANPRAFGAQRVSNTSDEDDSDTDMPEDF